MKNMYVILPAKGTYSNSREKNVEYSNNMNTVLHLLSFYEPPETFHKVKYRNSALNKALEHQPKAKDYYGKYIIASAGYTKKHDLRDICQSFDCIESWEDGFLYAVFTPLDEVIKKLSKKEIAFVLPITLLTAEIKKQIKEHWAGSAHFITDNGVLVHYDETLTKFVSKEEVIAWLNDDRTRDLIKFIMHYRGMQHWKEQFKTVDGVIAHVLQNKELPIMWFDDGMKMIAEFVHKEFEEEARAREETRAVAKFVNRKIKTKNKKLTGIKKVRS